MGQTHKTQYRIQLMRHYNKKGFTTVEMLIVAPIVILVLVVFIGVIILIVGDVMATRKSNAIMYDIQDALNRIEMDVKTSGGYLATNNFTPTAPQGLNDDATPFQNANSTTHAQSLILNSYATTDNPSGNATSRDVVFLANSPNACASTLVSKNNIMNVNIVYYSKGNTLWRRVIMPSNYLTAGCTVPWQKPSCSTGYTLAFCKTEDQKLVEGVGITDFKTDYYTSPSAPNPTTDAANWQITDTVRQTTLRTTNTVLVTITSRLTVSGRDVVQTGNVKAVSPNNNS